MDFLTEQLDPEKLDPEKRELAEYVLQLLRSGKTQESREFLEQVLEKTPDFAYGHLLLGITCQKDSEYDKALKFFEKALEINPRITLAPLLIGRIYKDQGDLQSAQAFFEASLDIDPDYAPAHIQIGREHLEYGELDQAIDCFEKVLNINPQNLMARLLMADVFADRNQELEAIDILENIIEDNPTMVVAYQKLGMIQLKLKQAEKAKQSCNKILSLDPSKDLARFMLGNAYFMLQEYHGAEAEFRLCSENLKNFKPAQYRLVDTLIELENYQDAMEVLRRLLVGARMHNSAHERIGIIYTKQGRYAFAVKEFNAALQHNRQLRESDPALTAILNAAENDPEQAAKAFYEKYTELSENGKLEIDRRMLQNFKNARNRQSGFQRQNKDHGNGRQNLRQGSKNKNRRNLT